MTKQPYPILEFDPERNALVSPKHSVKAPTLPEHGVLCFFNNEVNRLHQQGAIRKINTLKSEIGSHLIFAAEFKGREFMLFHPGVGGPLAAALFEEVIALGCRKFIACGGAGVLDGSLEVGKLIVPKAAIRDEGTSYHYLPPGREVAASERAVTAISHTLNKHNIGFELTKTWTTDAIYRETPDKIQQRKQQGCLVVEMEAASLFAVAQFRSVTIGQILYAGDDVSGATWENRGWVKAKSIRQKLIWLAAEACLLL